MKKSILLLALFIFVQTSFPQQQPPPQVLGTKQARPSAAWVKSGILYEIYPRAFSAEGNFAGIEAKLPELKQLGVTILWIMPIHPIGVEHRKGTLGSSYSVRDYYAVNPKYGTMDDFKRLVLSAHKLGLKVIIDMVANHTSWDSKLIKQHPDWFTKDSTGRIVSPVADWSDVADLDYSKPALREYMIGMLEYWVREAGIDGYRCDVAEMVPTDFWNEARAALDKIKPVFMLSEGQYPEHHLKAFDATYGWSLYHLLELLIAGERDGHDLDQILSSEALNFPKGSIRLRFSSNHDENAWDNPDVIKYGLDGAKLAAVIVNTFPGMPLLYNGQETGSAVKLGLFEKSSVDWNAHPEFREFYTTLFGLRKAHPALYASPLKRLKSTDTTHIYAFTRSQGKETIAVAYNFTTQAHMATLTLPGAKGAMKLTPLMTSADVKADIRGRTAAVTIPALGYAIYRVE
jgi:cyclomaltodextrinase / maltogenic alpha-amylase / neopullulanase